MMTMKHDWRYGWYLNQTRPAPAGLFLPVGARPRHHVELPSSPVCFYTFQCVFIVFQLTAAGPNGKIREYQSGGHSVSRAQGREKTLPEGARPLDRVVQSAIVSRGTLGASRERARLGVQ